ncbi:MAG: hypothetical protein WB791_07455 [Waddliaceae bacterium]
MSEERNEFSTSSKELEELIKAAIGKIRGRKENDICRYLPVETGGYIHHFTMRKMKYENPKQLLRLIKQFIIDVEKPKNVPPKPRAARGSRKRRDQFLFTKEDIERMLNMARIAGDNEMIRKLTPRKDLKQVKRELIASIRHNQVDHELWNSFVEAISMIHNALSETESVRVSS